MDITDWKELNLFNLLPNNLWNNKLMYIRGNITSLCYNSLYKVFCDSHGFIYVYFKNWDYNNIKSYEEAIYHCSICEDNILFTLVQNESNYKANIQIFELTKLTKFNTIPCIGKANLDLLSSVKTLNIFKIGLQICLVIVTEYGDLFLHRSDLTDDISNSFTNVSITKHLISGCYFLKKNSMTYDMFVYSEGCLHCHQIMENNNVADSKVILDDSTYINTELYSTELPEHFMVFGSDDSISCFTPNCRGHSLIIDGKKERLMRYRNYIIIIKSSIKSGMVIVILDILNNIVALKKNVEPVINIIMESNYVFLITATKKTYLIQEDEDQTKRRKFISKNLFDAALRVINSDNKIEKGKIHKQYGDYLLQKGEFKRAIEYYIRTIGVIDPFFIIEKLLNVRCNSLLTKYLEKLVENNNENNEYRRLLRNSKNRESLVGQVNAVESKVHKNIDIPEEELSLKIFIPKPIENCIITEENLFDLLFQYNESDVYNLLVINFYNLTKISPNIIASVLKSLCSRNKIQAPQKFLPLLLRNRSCCINFIDYLTENKVNDCKQCLHNILFVLILEEWKIDQSEEEKVNALLKHLITELSLNYNCLLNILISCSIFKFWHGIYYINERNLSSNTYLLHSLQFGKSETNVINHGINYDILQLFIRNISKKIYMKKNLANIIQNLINNNKLCSTYPLKILNDFVINKEILISDVRNFFVLNMLPKVSTAQYILPYEGINKFNIKLFSFINNPIEFRSSVCDKCNLQLKYPVIYYICQHSFHKHCVSTYSQIFSCVLCSQNSKSNKQLNIFKENKITDNRYLQIFAKRIISKLIYEKKQKILNSSMKSEYNAKYSNLDTSTNPFDE